jgi:hypothetical protein
MRHFSSPLSGIFAVSVLSAAVSSAIHAQTPALQEIEEVIVRAHPLSAEGLAQPVAVLSGETLKRVVFAFTRGNSSRYSRRPLVQLWTGRRQASNSAVLADLESK